MGMITRVRARLQSFSLPNRVHVKGQDDKYNRSVCILSVVLLLPYFTKYYSPVLLTSFTLIYSLFVVPLLLSGWPFTKLQHCVTAGKLIIKEWNSRIFTCLVELVAKFLNYKHRTECCFLEMKNLCAIFNQIMFFTLADTILCPDQKLTCLYSLMFYNVIAYCISYIKHLITKEDWSPYVRISETTNVKHLAMTTVKITLEFTKAVTFIITVVFMLLVFGLEQGLEHYKPTWVYIFITGFFYILTEKTFAEFFPNILEYFQFELLENLETLWAPVIIKLMTVTLTSVFLIPCLFVGRLRSACIAGYLNIYLGYKDLHTNSWHMLQKERALLMKYRFATLQEVKARDDVCAVCLQSMRFARVTPCNHMFHGDCLRRCLKERFSCPMCKQEL